MIEARAGPSASGKTIGPLEEISAPISRNSSAILHRCESNPAFFGKMRESSGCLRRLIAWGMVRSPVFDNPVDGWARGGNRLETIQPCMTDFMWHTIRGVDGPHHSQMLSTVDSGMCAAKRFCSNLLWHTLRHGLMHQSSRLKAIARP
jgi:hypothetical protein